jgi:hypothetical protein
MESVIEQNKDSYYLALRRTQQTIRKEEQNWEAWLLFFLKTMVKQKDNLATKVKETGAACIPARPFPPDSGAGENARRDYRQGNRGCDGREPQHHQGACEKAGGAALPYTGRQRTRRALYDQVVVAVMELRKLL